MFACMFHESRFGRIKRFEVGAEIVDWLFADFDLDRQCWVHAGGAIADGLDECIAVRHLVLVALGLECLVASLELVGDCGPLFLDPLHVGARLWRLGDEGTVSQGRDEQDALDLSDLFGWVAVGLLVGTPCLDRRGWACGSGLTNSPVSVRS